MARNSYDQTFNLLDFFLGRGGSQSVTDQAGFSFVEQSGRTNSGESVHVDNLLTEPTTLSCITAIVQGVTQIPVQIRRKLPDGTSEQVMDHQIGKLLHRPNDYQTASEFKSSIVTSMLTHGNAYILIVRIKDGSNDNVLSQVSGQPVFLYPLDASDITIGSDAFGAPKYHHEEHGNIPRANMIHIRDLQTFVPQGISRLIQAAEIIGAKRAADRLIAETFKNGASMNYKVETPGALDEAQREALRKGLESFNARGNKRGGVALLEGGATINPIDGIKPADVDLRDLRQHLIREIAAVMRVPVMMAGGDADATYNNVRQYWAAFHRDSLQPIVTNIEEAMTLKLLGSERDLCVHFDTPELLKGDVEVTARIAQQNVSNGIWTPNEARMYIGTRPYDGPNPEMGDLLIPPNSSTNTNVTEEEDPGAATGGPDGPQGRENEENNDG